MPRSNMVFRLAGGNEDNDLYVERVIQADGTTILVSTWELDDDDRAAIAAGGTIELVVWSAGRHPPVSLATAESLEALREAG